MADDGRRPSDLRLRALSSLVLIPIALALVWFGGVPFLVAVMVVAAIGHDEWLGIVGAKSPGIARLAEAAGLLALIFLVALDRPLAGLLVAAASLLPGAFLRAPRRHAWAAAGLVYVGLASVALVVIRGAEPGGLLAVAFLAIVVWTTDIAAYLVGRSLGGPKLWPAVSPKKTWSGAIGGLVAATGGAALLAAFVPGLLAGAALFAALVLSVAGQFGDLGESAVKRAFGVKDSGTIIPGHGGILDRVDALYAAAALALLLGLMRLSGSPFSFGPPG